MINKKVRNLIATLAITSISCNLAFAEIMDLRNPTVSEADPDESNKKIDIVKAQTVNIVNTIDTFTGDLFSTGNPNNGSKGVTISAAYLTPDKKFGYMYVDKYDYNGNGTVIAKYDQLNNSNKWGGNVNGNGGTSNNRLYNKAKEYFTNPSGPIYKNINETDDTQINKYNIQTDDNGKKFVAATFYVRYTYDFNDQHSVSGYTYLKSYPVLGNTSSYTSGPYIAMGDYFDDSIDIIIQGNNGRDAISSMYGKYFLKLSDLISSDINLDQLGLTYDYQPIQAISGNYVTYSTNKAMLEKRFEYRRYVSTRTEYIDNPAEYEFVYAVKKHTAKSQKVIPDISPKVSIKSSTEYTDSSRSTISRYAFDITMISKERDNYYQQTPQPYTIRKVSDRPSNEPGEDEMDLWHSDLVAYFDIVDSSGNSRLLSRKELTPVSSTIYITPNEIKEDSKGSKSLDNCTAKVTLNFKNNARFMSNKDVYTYKYTQNNQNKNYDQVINYINEKPTGLQLKTEIENYQTTTDPREVLIYKTETSKNRTIEATTGIFSITAGDYANAVLSVEVTPPNTLTVLEGANFTVDLDVNTNGVSIGFDGSDTWISDFKIDELIITSASGDTIHRETNIPINPSTPITVINKKINGLTAKPTQIGEATVKVTYSYIINKQTYEVVPIEDPGNVDANGDVTWEYKTIKKPLEKLPQNGIATNNFKIYSLTGNTVS